MIFKKHDNPFNFKIKKLSIVEESAFIDSVVSTCVSDGVYDITYFKPMFLIYLMIYFTDTKMINMTIKNDEDKDEEIPDVQATYNFCVDNKLFKQINKYCGKRYIGELYEKCLEVLEFQKQKYNNSMYGLIQDIRTIINNFSETTYPKIIDDVIPFIQKMNKANINNNNISNNLAKIIHAENSKNKNK